MRWLVLLLLVAPVAAQTSSAPIDIRSDNDWSPAGPAQSGSGTLDDPYIIADLIIERSALDLDREAPAIRIEGTEAHVRFENIQIREAYNQGVHVKDAANLVFSGLDIQNAGRAMDLQGVTNTAVLDSWFSNNGPDKFAAGILIQASQGVVVRGAVFEAGEAPGIRVSTSNNIRLEGVAITDHDGGLRIHSSERIELVGVHLSENRGDGAWISNVTDLEILDFETLRHQSQGGPNSGRGVVIWDAAVFVQGITAKGNAAAGATILNSDVELRVGRFLDNQGPGLHLAAPAQLVALEAHGNKGAGISVGPPGDGPGAIRATSLQLHENRGAGLAIQGLDVVDIRDVRTQWNEGAGIDIRASQNLSVVDARLLDNQGDGLLLVQVHTGRVADSLATGNDDGFAAWESSAIRFHNNTARTNHGSGFIVEGAVELVGNHAEQNGAYGVLVHGDEALLEGNTLEGNVAGDELEQKQSPMVLALLPLLVALGRRHQFA